MRRFFYASAAILCLALAFHMGATSAQGQSNPMLRFLGGGNNVYYVQSGSDIYLVQGNGWHLVPPSSMPPTSDQFLYYTGGWAITYGGEAYENLGVWVDHGTIPGGATSTIRQSFGALKAKYR